MDKLEIVTMLFVYKCKPDLENLNNRQGILEFNRILFKKNSILGINFLTPNDENRLLYGH